MKHNHTAPFVLFAIALLAAAGCDAKKKSLEESVDKLGRATGPVERPARPIMAAGQEGPAQKHTGKVLETIDVPNYTYLKLATENGETWAAIPQSKIPVGEKVTVLQSLVMKDFESPTLKRTFKSVVFGVIQSKEGTDTKVETPESSKAALPEGHPPV